MVATVIGALLTIGLLAYGQTTAGIVVGLVTVGALSWWRIPAALFRKLYTSWPWTDRGMYRRYGPMYEAALVRMHGPLAAMNPMMWPPREMFREFVTAHRAAGLPPEAWVSLYTAAAADDQSEGS